jgi:omega-6 fatty acid desaturase (delta-12 desaturase)
VVLISDSVPADFNPNSVLFSPHQRNLVLLSNIGVALWFLGLFAAIYAYGFAAVFTVYLVPYLWSAASSAYFFE